MAEMVPAPADQEPGRVLDRVRPDVARWELDTRALRPMIARAASGAALAPDWVEAMLAGARIACVNGEVEQRVGAYFGQADMRGRAVGSFWPPESRADLAAMVLAVCTDGARAARRTRPIASLLLRDPRLTVWRTEAHGPDRVFVEVEGTLKDERSHWALRASEARYRQLLHHLPLALLQVDARRLGDVFVRLRARGIDDLASYLDAHPALIAFASRSVRVTEANRSAEQLFAGSDLPGPIGRLFAIPAETTRRVLIARFDGRRSHCEQTRLRTCDGRVLDVRLTVTFPMPPEQADVTLVGIEDVTERLRTEAQLRQLQADFARAARIALLGELATSIAHEVSQPLAAILTNAETSLRWLDRDEPNLAKVGQLAARIAASAGRASEIVQRIRGMAAQRAPEQELLDLGDAIREALLFVEHELETRAIALVLDLPAGLPPTLGDRVQVQQVVVNLLVNAIQAQAGVTDSRIAIAAETSPDGMVHVSIRDGGPGIAPEHLDRVFTGFFTTKGEGIGIGLAICQSIVAAHGGTMTASNHPQGGAVLRFALPAA